MVTAGLSPRQALAGVEARLAAAGCPDAAFDARELFRLAVAGTPGCPTGPCRRRRPPAWKR